MLMLSRFFPYEYAESVFDIDYAKLYAKGFRGVIFDIDNTLVHHGEPSTPRVDELFAQIHAAGLKTLLLSDNTKERVEMFNKNINTLYIDSAGKPDPGCCKKALTPNWLTSKNSLPLTLPAKVSAPTPPKSWKNWRNKNCRQTVQAARAQAPPGCFFCLVSTMRAHAPA